MPIRINLKELFPSDSQDLTADKINFNFNKLLELGIGEQGLRGFSGIQGSAGPVGIIGPAGDRGSTWFLDTASDPSTLTFTDLQEGDLYLDTLNFGVWQYSGGSWNFVFDLTNIINSYLAASPSPFTRGLGTGSPRDDRYIVFKNRGDSTDVALGAVVPTNNPNNDVLFLNNFDESLPEYGPLPELDFGNTNDDYNALLKIFTDNVSTTPEIGRYHLEMGVLYEETPGVRKLTNIIENLKMYFYRQETVNTLHGLDYYTTGIWSLDIPLGFGPLSRTTNSSFEFRFPKVGGSSPDASSIYIGSRYGMDQIIDNAEDISFIDGIMFSEQATNTKSAIGIAERFNILNNATTATPIQIPSETGYITNIPDSQSYLMLDNLFGDLYGIYLNKKVLQNGGNIVQVATTPPRIPVVHTSDLGSPGNDNFIGQMGIAAIGNQIYTVSGDIAYGTAATDLADYYGYINKFTIENPNNPLEVFTGYGKHNAKVSGTPSGIFGSVGYIDYDSNRPIGIALSDIDIVGEYAYAVNSQVAELIASDYTSGSDVYKRTYFQIWKLGVVNQIAPARVSRLGYQEMGGSSGSAFDPIEVNGAYRVKVKGSNAIVATNALHTNSSISFLGNGVTPVAGLEYEGLLTAVDISNATNPRIIASQIVSTPTTMTGLVRSAIMDMEIIDDFAVTLTWHQQVVPSGTANVQIRVQGYNLSGLNSSTPTIVEKGTTNSLFTTTCTDLQYRDIPKRGAITVNKKYIYAGWENQIRIYYLDLGTINGSNVRKYNQYGVITLPLSVTASSGSKYGVQDLKQLGNSLYVLAIDSDGKSYALKYDISNGLSDASLNFNPLTSLIWQKELTDGIGTKMKIVGKHIYVASHNAIDDEANTISLIPLDFDGIYTGGAHIESLRADELTVIGDIEVGQGANISGDATIGGSEYVANNLSVGGSANVTNDLSIGADSYIGGDLDVSGSVNGSIFTGIGISPVGSVTAFAGSGLPAGWLECDGSQVSRTAYSLLYSAIGNSWGYGDNSTTFNLPDLRGVFLRGKYTTPGPRTFTNSDVNLSADTITILNHGFRHRFPIKFSGGSLPSTTLGTFTAGAPYYVLVIDANTIKIGRPDNFLPYDLNGVGSGTIYEALETDSVNRTPAYNGGSSGENVGSYQPDEFKSHTHSGGFFDGGGQGFSTNSSGTFLPVGGDQRTYSSGGNETRPLNAYVKYIIYTGKV